MGTGFACLGNVGAAKNVGVFAVGAGVEKNIGTTTGKGAITGTGLGKGAITGSAKAKSEGSARMTAGTTSENGLNPCTLVKNPA
jgi:hypothetical protein